MPESSSHKPQTARLTARLSEVLRAGHPWVFADAVSLPPKSRTGDVVDLVDGAGAFVARGTVDRDTTLAFRSWTTVRDEAVDEALLVRRLRLARALRDEAVPATVTALRVCHGECDGVPGLHADRYDDVLSIRSDGPLGRAWEERYVDALEAVWAPRAVVARNRLVADGEARVLRGQLDAEVEIREGERRFLVDVLRGQKTGFFVDQRDNRDRVAALSAGRSVLNVFAYTGGFSVAAALAGASRVTTVDIARPAVEAAERNFTLNGIDPRAHGFIVGDAFEVLADASTLRAAHDLIVVDPPSFAPRRSAVDRGRKAYVRLNELAIRALAPGGWLATASCSSHIRGAEFTRAVAEAAARAGRRLAVVGVFGAGADHPSIPAFPEGDYLDFVLARAMDG